MKQRIELLSRNIEYTLTVSSRAKRIRIRISPGGEVFVTKPRLVPSFFVTRFMNQKAEWIIRTHDSLSRLSPSVSPSIDKKAFEKYKTEALTFVKEKLPSCNAHYSFVWNIVSIRNQKTRWGSCSKKGNLNFSYKLILLPVELAEYIIVHELCHLKEFNHGKQFWNLVAKTYPDHKELRKKLQKYNLANSLKNEE